MLHFLRLKERIRFRNDIFGFISIRFQDYSVRYCFMISNLLPLPQYGLCHIMLT